MWSEILRSIVKWMSDNTMFTLLGAVTIIQITPIKINPWSTLFSLLQKALGIQELKEILIDHIVESNRMEILDFANACMNHRKHTEEQFKKIINRCDWYEDYIETNDLKNGEISCAIASIRDIYKQCRKDNSFL